MMNPADTATAGKLEGKILLGRGFTSDVYAWGEARVLKLFHSAVPRAKVDREYRATRAVCAARLPAPAAYERVQIQGRDGIVFERIEGVSMFKQVQARPWTLLKAVRQFAELHARIHDCAAPADLPSQREWIGGGIDAADLTLAEKQQARHHLSVLPDGESLCHGDFHPDNIIFTARGPVIIDWGAATRGHRLGDVACTSRLIQKAGLPAWAPWHMHLLLKFSRALLHRRYLNRYLQLQPGTEAEIQAWQAPLSAAGLKIFDRQGTKAATHP